MALLSRIDIMMFVVMLWLPGQRLTPIKIEPSTPTVDVGQSVALRGVDESGQAVDVKWFISDPQVATITREGGGHWPCRWPRRGAGAFEGQSGRDDGDGAGGQDARTSMTGHHFL